MTTVDRDVWALDALDTWYTAHVGDHHGPFVDIDIAAAGRSNITAILTDTAGRQTVLRRPPDGVHHHTAHDVRREARIMSALMPTAVPVPPVVASSDETGPLGVPFIIMEFVGGHVLDTVEDADVLSATERLSVARQLAQHLASLHSIDPVDIGLDTLASAADFISRQLSRFERQWKPVDDEVDRIFVRATEGLRRHRIDDHPTARVVHGDYRIGNTIVDDGEIRAVLDWELTTLGHPLTDLAYLLNNWVDASEAAEGPITSPIAAGGFGSRDDVVAEYRRSGHDVDDTVIDYLRALSYWRLASIRSGVVARLGTSPDPVARSKADSSRRSIPQLLDLALELLGEGDG